MSELNVRKTDLVYAYFDSFAHSNIGAVGSVVDRKVVSIDRKKGIVIVDAGLKSEGIIPMKEFFKKDDEQNLQVGDSVKVYVMSVDGHNGNF
jgi:small subunit ribosomal protein S1